MENVDQSTTIESPRPPCFKCFFLFSQLHLAVDSFNRWDNTSLLRTDEARVSFVMIHAFLLIALENPIKSALKHPFIEPNIIHFWCVRYEIDDVARTRKSGSK